MRLRGFCDHRRDGKPSQGGVEIAVNRGNQAIQFAHRYSKTVENAVSCAVRNSRAGE